MERWICGLGKHCFDVEFGGCQGGDAAAMAGGGLWVGRWMGKGGLWQRWPEAVNRF